MPEETVIRLCAPTLAGLKTGSLFSTEYHGADALDQEVAQLNRMLNPKGLRAVTMRYGQNRALIYLYRPDRLRMDLRQKEALALLKTLGYQETDSEVALATLIDRVRSRSEFPHEIGLFLSYPPEDVLGFIKQGASHCKSVGTWKVYGDVEKAEKTFRKYRHCTEVYCRQYRKGTSMDQLTVAGR